MTVPMYIHHSGWPWPLDAVQNWFEALWDGLGTAINNAATWVWERTPEPLKRFIDYLKDISGDIWSKILAFFKDPLGSIKGGFDWVISGVRDLVGWWDPKQGRFVGGFLGWLWDTLEGVATWISDAASWIYKNVAAGLATLNSVITGAINTLGGAFSEGLEWLSNKAKSFINEAVTWASETFTWLADKVNDGLEWVVNSVGTMFDGASTILGDVIGSVFSGPLGTITEFFGGVSGLLNIGRLGELAQEVTPILDGVNATYLAPLARHSPLTPEEASSDVMKFRSQQRDHWYHLFFYVFGTELGTFGQAETPATMMLSEPQIKASLDLTTEWFKAPYEYGYGPLLEQFWNKVYTPLLPPVVDLIRFVVREVITPERFREVMPYLGFKEEWAAAYWEAHWVLPAPTVLVDAFHRKALSAEELDKFLIWHDFKPDARPGISISDVAIQRSVLKTLIPRVDLRYGWEMGRLTDEELLERYEYLGYEDDAPLMADIQRLRAMTEEIHKVRDEWLRYFISGFILEDTLRANLEAIGIGPMRVDYYVVYARKRREREQLADLMDLYRDGFMKDLITEEDLRARISEILVDAEAVDLYVERAYVDKYKKPSPPKATDEDKALAELQKYEISYAIEAYRRYALDKDELIERLIAAGVHAAVAATRADYEELKRPVPKPTDEAIARAKEEAKIQSLAVKTHIEEYKAYTIDESELVSKLVEAGLSEALAVAYTQLEIIRRGAPPE